MAFQLSYIPISTSTTTATRTLKRKISNMGVYLKVNFNLRKVSIQCTLNPTDHTTCFNLLTAITSRVATLMYCQGKSCTVKGSNHCGEFGRRNNGEKIAFSAKKIIGPRPLGGVRAGCAPTGSATESHTTYTSNIKSCTNAIFFNGFYYYIAYFQDNYH